MLDQSHFHSLRLNPCETSHKHGRVPLSLLALAILAFAAAPARAAQEPRPATPPAAGHAAPAPGQAPATAAPVEPTAPVVSDPHAAPAAGSPTSGTPAAAGAEHAAAPAHAEGAAAPGQEGQAAAHEGAKHGEGHAESPLAFAARIANFFILVGVLVYFLRKPFNDYLAGRGQQISSDLVTAKETTATANAQLAEIDRKLAALPAEIEALKVRGTQEIAAEELRIRQAADAERHRLIEQTRREIELQVRLAKRTLTEHAATLAVELAGQQIEQTITPADQTRLIDRYVSQVRNAHD